MDQLVASNKERYAPFMNQALIGRNKKKYSEESSTSSN